MKKKDKKKMKKKKLGPNLKKNEKQKI